jgi:hypothetical protein
MKKQFRFILMLLIISSSAFVANGQSTGIVPFVDEIVDDPFSDKFVVLFGYNNPNSTAVTIKHGNNNLFFPSPSNRGQPEKFEPGVHHRVITVLSTLPITPEGGGLIWFLDGKLATANQNMLGTLSQTTAFTYQGRLAEAGAPANGSNDLRFALFDAETAGAQKGSAIVKEDVQVTNGNFTVILDFGAAPIFSTSRSFLEIGVRAATSTGAFTTLAPRQSVTPSPYAIRAISASTADSATNAQNLGGRTASEYVQTDTASFIRSQTSQQIANFNISGNGTIGSTLTTSKLVVNDNSSSLQAARIESSNTSGTVLRLKNTSTGGAEWDIASTGSDTPEGAGKLLFINGNTTRMILGASGNLSIDGSLFLGLLGAGGSTQLCRNTSNQISTCSSSLRYKTNIAPFNFGLNLVNRLRPITFDWKDGGMRDLGLAAEDVAAVEPLLVTSNERGGIEGVKYDRIGVVLLNAVKEQQGQIEKQNSQLEEQRKQLMQQQETINGLKKIICTQNPTAEVCN